MMGPSKRTRTGAFLTLLAVALMVAWLGPLRSFFSHVMSTLSELPQRRREANEAAPDLPQCGHVILFSARRHGSTWLINSVERCRYKKPAQRGVAFFNASIYPESELWNRVHPGAVVDIAPLKAARYARWNTSIKVFPNVVINRETQLRELLVEARRLHVPVLMMRRNVHDAYGSLVEATRRQVWNKNKGGRGAVRTPFEGEKFEQWRRMIDGSFNRSLEILNELDISVDVWQYGEVVNRRFIVAERNGCYVANCNFG